MDSAQHQKRKARRKRSREDPEIERLNSLSWNLSLSQNDDRFPFLLGSNELEGGFFSLEEIDEAEYGLEIPDLEEGKGKKSENKLGFKKQKLTEVEGACNDEAGGILEENKDESAMTVKKEKKKKKKKKKKRKEVSEQVMNVKDDNDDEDLDEMEFCAWNELRLHPLLMKAIYKLGLKEPTPIQKACIPAAAHQGKDVVGASETGSGKTLAFGLPILQRLLEEREKAARMVEQRGEEPDRYAPTGFLRALIITPTWDLAKQVSNHLKAVAKYINVRVTHIIGGEAEVKQEERSLKERPEIIVGTPGRLWQFMSAGEKHLVELHSLSFFVLDEADQMIKSGYFKELQSIIDMLPMSNMSSADDPQSAQNCITISSYQRKKRQTLLFSATVALSADFRKKLKHASIKQNQSVLGGFNSIEALSVRTGMRPNAAVIDLTNATVLPAKLEESFIECEEDNKDACLYYILTVHRQGRTIVFCTSITAALHISSLLGTLGIQTCNLHSRRQQKGRFKDIECFRNDENGILVATDVAARGLDIPGVRAVVHYQLPHSADVYVHRSGRTARASADGCSIALISPKDKTKFDSLRKSLSKDTQDTFRLFPLEESYMPDVQKRLSIARQIDKIIRKNSREKTDKNWYERNAKAAELDMENYESEEERVEKFKQMKACSAQLKNLQQELNVLLSRPLLPKGFSHRNMTGARVTDLMQEQLQQLARQKQGSVGVTGKGKLVVLGQECVEPLQALRKNGEEVRMDSKKMTGKRIENLKRKRKEEKKRLRDQRRNQKKEIKMENE